MCVCRTLWCVYVFVCLGMGESRTCVIVPLHLTVPATAIRTVSGLQFQKAELKYGREGRKRCKTTVKLKCEASFMRIILISQDKGKVDTKIFPSLLFPVTVCFQPNIYLSLIDAAAAAAASKGQSVVKDSWSAIIMFNRHRNAAFAFSELLIEDISVGYVCSSYGVVRSFAPYFCKV